MDTLKLKITITKIKNSTDGINRTLDRAKGKTIKLEDRVFKNNQTETQRKTNKQAKQKHRTDSKEHVHVQNGLLFLCLWSLRRKKESKKMEQKQYLKRQQLSIFQIDEGH